MKNHEHEKASDRTEAADVQSDEPSAVFYSMAIIPGQLSGTC
jgi:hypothetical protein